MKITGWIAAIVVSAMAWAGSLYLWHRQRTAPHQANTGVVVVMTPSNGLDRPLCVMWDQGKPEDPIYWPARADNVCYIEDASR